MKKFKLFLLAWPLVLLIGMGGYSFHERRQIDRQLSEPDNMIWTHEKQDFIVHIEKTEDGELLNFIIRVTSPDSTDIYRKNETIDRDMFGGGFVRATQIDDDPELEIIVWQVRSSYILDFKAGQVKLIPFDIVSQDVKNLAKKWHQYNVMAGLETTLLFLFVFCYYVIYFVLNFILNLYNRKR